MSRPDMGKLLILLTTLLFMSSCTGFDDEPLPQDARDKVYFQQFEIDPRRNYIIGRLINDSPYTLTSCQIEIKIYQEKQASDSPLILTEGRLGDAGLSSMTPIISDRLFMREALKSGYSTEIYFELLLQDFRGEAVYTREIIEMKGKTSP